MEWFIGRTDFERVDRLLWANEAGKTTLLQFVRSILYGFSYDRCEKYLPPVYGGNGGGSLFLDSKQGDYQVQRLANKGWEKQTGGDLALTSAAGNTAGKDTLLRLLGDVDEYVFSNVFAIGLREIQELATLNDTDAAHELYKLASGMDRVSLIDVMRQLRKSRVDWLGEGEQGGQMAKLSSELKDTERQIEQARGGARRWAKLGSELQVLEAELKDLAESITQQEKEGRRVELAIQIAPLSSEREGIWRRIESLGKLPDEDLISVERLDRVNQRATQLEARVAEGIRRLTEIKGEGKSLPINDMLLEQSCRIEAMTEHQPWFQSLARQIEHLRDESQQIQEEMGIRKGEYIDDGDGELPEVFEITSRTLSILKTPARTLRKARSRITGIEQEREKAELSLVAAQEDLDAQLEALGCEDLDMSLEDMAKTLNEIKRRRQIDERLKRLDQQRRQLEDEMDDSLDIHTMPVGRTLIVGIFVVLGLGLALFGFSGYLLRSVEPNPNLGVLGLLMASIGLVVKLWGDSQARSRLDRTQRQHELLLSQMTRTKREREELDARFPDDGRDFDARQQDAERAFSQLEELLPIRERVADSEAEMSEHDELFEQAKQYYESAQKKWEASLRSVNLPTSLTPPRVKALSAQSEKINDSRERLANCRRELRHREEELVTLKERVQRIALDVELDTESTDPHEVIEELGETLADQRRLMERQREMQRDYKDLRKQVKNWKRHLRRIESYRSRMLESAGARDEKTYRDFALKLSQRHDLTTKLEEYDRQIDAAIGRQYDREEILKIVSERGAGGLETYWDALQKKIEKLETRRAEMNVTRGERMHEMKTLGEDRSLDELELHAETLRRRLKKGVLGCQTTAIANSILDSVRKRYEKERQPETLTEASRYLKGITEGKYRRIWTRIEGDSLFVDQRDGQSLRVDYLSQGTREAIFLSLRLALASAYSRRGIEFPLVLDDLLVNYDAERTRSAARVLVDYASKGRQVIFFTCHDHIRDLFCELEADVRVLPSQRDVMDRDATAERYFLPKYVEPEPEPVWEEVVEEPVIEEPVIEEPVIEEVIEEPVVEVVEEVIEEPIEEEVIIEEPEEEVEVEPAAEEVEFDDELQRERFTWNSPDMWWEDDEDAA